VIKRALRSQGWSEESIAAAEQYAHQEGIPSLRAAAADWRQQQPEPVQAASSGWDFFGSPADNGSYVQELFETRGESEAALRNEISRTSKSSAARDGSRRQ
jgi:hypothetical protein